MGVYKSIYNVWGCTTLYLSDRFAENRRLLFFRDQLSHESRLAGHFHNGDRRAEEDGIDIPSDLEKNGEIIVEQRIYTYYPPVK